MEKENGCLLINNLEKHECFKNPTSINKYTINSYFRKYISKSNIIEAKAIIDIIHSYATRKQLLVIVYPTNQHFNNCQINHVKSYFSSTDNLFNSINLTK